MQFIFKNFITFSLLLLFVASNIYAKTSFKIEPLSDKSFVLHLELKEPLDVSIKLRDRKGVVLVEETVNDTLAFSKKYNLKTLPKGTYTLTIEDQLSICKLPMALTGDQLSIDYNKQKEITKPMFLVHKKSVDVLLVLSEKTNTEMYIYDSASNKIYAQKGKHTESIRRRFDLSKLESGKYTIVVIANGVVSRESYSIRNGMIKS